MCGFSRVPGQILLIYRAQTQGCREHGQLEGQLPSGLFMITICRSWLPFSRGREGQGLGYWRHHKIFLRFHLTTLYGLLVKSLGSSSLFSLTGRSKDSPLQPSAILPRPWEVCAASSSSSVGVLPPPLSLKGRIPSKPPRSQTSFQYWLPVGPTLRHTEGVRGDATWNAHEKHYLVPAQSPRSQGHQAALYVAISNSSGRGQQF